MMAATNSANPYATSPTDAPRHRPSRMPYVFGCLGALVVGGLLCVTAVVAFFLGAIRGESDLYRNRAAAQRESIEEFFAQHPTKYTKLTIYETSNGYAVLDGTVASEDDYDMLAVELLRLLGEETAECMLSTVHVEPTDSP